MSFFIIVSFATFMEENISTQEKHALVEPCTNMAWTQSVMDDCQVRIWYPRGQSQTSSQNDGGATASNGKLLYIYAQ